jgi:ribonucleoside-diphosphate reductase alpha subunit
LSNLDDTHATPTLFSSGMERAQMSSCFLLDMREDSISGIFDTLKQCALISKFAGGIGLNVTRVRATDSYIAGTNGRSNGIIPMLRIFNNTARYVDQGGGKRKGSFAMYLEPWHADVEDFLELRKNNGKEESRARDLFLALWVPDLFMKRVEARGVWSLFCPHECPGLTETYGDEFEALYVRYESEGRARKQISAVLLWQKIMTAQIETGTPYMLFKDHVNRKSQQENIGIIRSSNLCAEIVEHTSADEVAVCNLASLNLSRFHVEGGLAQFADSGPSSRHFPDVPPELVDRSEFMGFREINFVRLYRVTRAVVRNLNGVIDGNAYPVDEARSSNLRNRPVGLGVQGLADLFAKLELPFDSPRAMLLNRLLFETIYHAAVRESIALAARYGAYPSYPGSPASRGLLQFDLWAEQGHFDRSSLTIDWAPLKRELARHGMRNSLLVALMPTASTSQILGNNESFEPFTSNLYSRRTLAGEFAVVNKHLQRTLIARGLWDRAMVERIMAANGSIQEIAEVPDSLKATFRTVWEIPQRSLVDMAMQRGPFVDQTQSFNVFMATPTVGKLSAMLFYSWRAGAKTGSYYLRTKPSAQPIKFTVKVAPAAAAPGAAHGGAPSGGGGGEDEEQGACESCSA